MLDWEGRYDTNPLRLYWPESARDEEEKEKEGISISPSRTVVSLFVIFIPTVQSLKVALQTLNQRGAVANIQDAGK